MQGAPEKSETVRGTLWHNLFSPDGPTKAQRSWRSHSVPPWRFRFFLGHPACLVLKSSEWVKFNFWCFINASVRGQWATVLSHWMGTALYVADSLGQCKTEHNLVNGREITSIFQFSSLIFGTYFGTFCRDTFCFWEKCVSLRYKIQMMKI